MRKYYEKNTYLPRCCPANRECCGNREYATDYLDDKAAAEKAAELLAETAAKRALPEKKNGGIEK